MIQNQVLDLTTIDEKEAKALLEAALYVAGRPLDLKTLGSVIKIRSKKKVKALAKLLAEEYSKREGESCFSIGRTITESSFN